MLSKYVYIFLWVFLCGIIFAHSFAMPVFLTLPLIILGLSGLSGVLVFKSGDLLFSVLCFVFVVCLGFSIGLMIWSNSQQVNQFQNDVGKQVNTEGVVVGWPNLTSSGNQAILIKPDGFTQAVRASLRAPIMVHPNDRVWVRGVIKQPENFSGFNYIAYLQKNNVYAELDKAKVIVIDSGQNNSTAILGKVREWVILKSEQRLSKTSSGLVLGMLIGYGDSLPKTLAEAFKKTGLTHILVASGFNLTIIASSIGFFAWIIGRRWSDVLSILILWMFVILTGSSGSVVRAGIMTSLILLARSIGRMPTSYFTLLLAVVVMVMLNPLQLFYDIGFQLSVGATLGVLEANRLRVHLQKEGWLTELLWPTMGAIIFTAPIISLYFGTFSIIAPLANLAVLPAVPIVMLLGALSLLPIINLMTVPITELIVAFQEGATVFLSEWKYSSVSIKSTLIGVIIYYVVLYLIKEVYYSRKSADLNKPIDSDKMTKIII